MWRTRLMKLATHRYYSGSWSTKSSPQIALAVPVLLTKGSIHFSIPIQPFPSRWGSQMFPPTILPWVLVCLVRLFDVGFSEFHSLFLLPSLPAQVAVFTNIAGLIHFPLMHYFWGHWKICLWFVSLSAACKRLLCEERNSSWQWALHLLGNMRSKKLPWNLRCNIPRVWVSVGFRSSQGCCCEEFDHLQYGASLLGRLLLWKVHPPAENRCFPAEQWMNCWTFSPLYQLLKVPVKKANWRCWPLPWSPRCKELPW